MADVLNRTTGELLKSVHTPDYSTATHIINPDLSSVSGVPSKYWGISGDTVSEKTQTEKDTVDAADAAADKTVVEAAIKVDALHDPLSDLTVDTEISGLSITGNIGPVRSSERVFGIFRHEARN